MGWSRRNFAPTVFLSIEGKTADDLLGKLISFSYKKTLDKAAETTMVFRNDERNLMSDKRFLANTNWSFRYGYFNDLSPIITGTIRNVQPVYADKRTVTVTLLDLSMRLSKSSEGKNWGRVESSTIARKIAAKYDLQAEVDPSKDRPAKDFIQPASVNDLQYTSRS